LEFWEFWEFWDHTDPGANLRTSVIKAVRHFFLSPFSFFLLFPRHAKKNARIFWSGRR